MVGSHAILEKFCRRKKKEGKKAEETAMTKKTFPPYIIIRLYMHIYFSVTHI